MNILKISFSVLFATLVYLFPVSENPFLKPSLQLLKSGSLSGSNVIFQSLDYGKTWQDISNGLPAQMEDPEFFTNNNKLFIHSKDEMYVRNSNTLSPAWEKDPALKFHGNVSICKSGIFAIAKDGKIFKRNIGKNTWSRVFKSLPIDENPRNLSELRSGVFMIAGDNGLFRSSDGGKIWKKVHKGSMGNIQETNGVLLATSQEGIIRSTDNGLSWKKAVSEGGVGIYLTRINDGFVGITYNSTLKSRRVRISKDDGKTWQAIDAGLPRHANIANVIQAGNFYYCGHPDGIFRSSDKGKHWELIHSTVDDKVFNLSVSGKVIYAIAKSGGC